MSLQNNPNFYSGHSHSFDTGIAKNLGVTAAIVFNHIVYWLRINAAKGVNVIEDKVWMYESQQEIASFLEYLSLEEVKKAIVKLLDSGLLIKNNFNKNPFDKTNWYTTSDHSIIQKSLTKAPCGAIDGAIRRYPQRPMAPCILDKKEQHKNNDDDDRVRGAEQKRLSDDIEVTGLKGEKITASISEVYRRLLKFSPEIVKEAIDKIRSISTPVNDIFKYLEKTCENLVRKEEVAKNQEKKSPKEAKSDPKHTQIPHKRHDMGVSLGEFLKQNGIKGVT